MWKWIVADLKGEPAGWAVHLVIIFWTMKMKAACSNETSAIQFPRSAKSMNWIDISTKPVWSPWLVPSSFFIIEMWGGASERTDAPRLSKSCVPVGPAQVEFCWNQLYICIHKRVHLKSKPQYTEILSAATWPARRPCCRPAVFYPPSTHWAFIPSRKNSTCLSKIPVFFFTFIKLLVWNCLTGNCIRWWGSVFWQFNYFKAKTVL